MVFIPAGKRAAAVPKALGELALGEAGIKLIGPGDITPDEALAGMGAAARGVLTRASLLRRRHPPRQPGFRRGAWKKA